MSDTPLNGPGGPDIPDGEPSGRPLADEASLTHPAPERTASVRLRHDAGAGDASLMDPANQSLADALKITFRLVQLAMVVLAGLFIFSGFQTVNEGERGVSILFGRPAAIDLEPGFRFAAPYPFGELEKVQTGALSPKVDTAFWPDANNPTASEANIGRQRSLVPGRHGSLITADLNLAHTQWQVTYRRDRVGDFVRNVLPGDERAIVLHAVERAVVRAVAETTIDDLLKPEGGTRELAQRVQELAQASLNGIAGPGPDGVPEGIGVRIEQIDLERKIPPTMLMQEFAGVITARSEAQRARTEAEAGRAETLNAVAGQASGVLLEQIRRYEVAIETGNREGAEVILATIDRLLIGETVEIDGRQIAGVTSGDVTQLLAEAESDRASTVNRARSDLAMFEAKLAQFEANPQLMIARDWADAYAIFLGKPFVQTQLLPEGAAAELWLNEDPDIVKEIDRAQKRREAMEAAADRERARQLDRFRTQQGIQREEE